MAKNKYTVKYFIKKFKAIPHTKWHVGEFTNELGAYCALGHCGARTVTSADNCSFTTFMTYEAEALNKLLIKEGAADINDCSRGISKHLYKLKTPKGRILRALKDLL